MKKLYLLLIVVPSMIQADWYCCATKPAQNLSESRCLIMAPPARRLFEAPNANDAFQRCKEAANRREITEVALYKHKTFPYSRLILKDSTNPDAFAEKLSLSSVEKESLEYQKGKTYSKEMSAKNKQLLRKQNLIS